MDPAVVATGEWSPARTRYAQRQRERLLEYEDRLRRDLVLDERAARTAQLDADFEDFRAGIATITASGSESQKRSRLVAMQEAEAEVLRSVHADAALSTVLLPREIVDRRATISVEEIERAELRRAVSAQAAMRAFDDVARQEAKWRRVLEQQAAAEGAPMWRDAITQQLVFLVTPAGTHAEPHYRRFIELSERRDRRALAFTFCRVNAMWFEEWERMTLQLSTRCVYGYLREYATTSREEALAREELRLLHEPLATDIHEELQHRAERCRRRETKLEALTALRRAEVNRLVAQRRTGNSEVDGWKVAELDRIADLHAQMLADLVAYSPASPPRGDDDDDDEEERALARHESAVGVASRVAEHLESNLDRLSHPKAAFREIVAYRKRLQGFDNFVSQVEAAIGTPEMLRSRPVLDSPQPPSMMIGGGGGSRDAGAAGSPDASPQPITWSSRRRSQHQRYRIDQSPRSSVAPSMSTNAADASPFDLDRYEATAAAATGTGDSAKGAPVGWAADQHHLEAALVPVANDEPSAQELIADEIRLALRFEERAGSDDGPMLAITAAAGGEAHAEATGEQALLEGARRREDQEEMRTLEQHTSALEALHQHLMRFV